MLCNIDDTLRVRAGRGKAVLAVDSFDGQAGRRKGRRDLFGGVGALGEALLHPLVQSVLRLGEDGEIHLDHIVGEEGVLPRTEDLVVIVDKGVVREDFPMLVAGVEVEDKDPVRVEEEGNLGDRRAEIPVIGQVV